MGQAGGLQAPPLLPLARARLHFERAGCALIWAAILLCSWRALCPASRCSIHELPNVLLDCSSAARAAQRNTDRTG